MTYTITTPAAVTAAKAVSIVVSGLTNTSVVGSYTSQIVTNVTTAGASVATDSVSAGPIAFTAGTLSGPTWTASRATVGTTGVTYTYSLTTATTGNNLTSVTMTVPPGTAGTPVVSMPGSRARPIPVGQPARP